MAWHGEVEHETLWNRHVNELDWFDQDKLDELGFDGSFLKLAESRNRYYQPLPIKAFVVLEYEGEARETFRDKQRQEIAELPAKVARGEMEPEAAERRNKELETLLRLASRLFAVDVGTEAATLRGRYPDTEHWLYYGKRSGRRRAPAVITAGSTTF